MATLSPFLTGGQNISETVLIVGSEGTGKHIIAQSLVDMAVTARLKIHTCSLLPLPEDSQICNTNFAFICFLMHVGNKESFKALVHNIGQVDVSYFLGRSAIVVNTSGAPTDQPTLSSQILQIGNQYGIQVFFMDIQNDTERAELGRNLMMMLEVAQGQHYNVTPLLLDTVYT